MILINKRGTGIFIRSSSYNYRIYSRNYLWIQSDTTCFENIL